MGRKDKLKKRRDDFVVKVAKGQDVVKKEKWLDTFKPSTAETDHKYGGVLSGEKK